MSISIARGAIAEPNVVPLCDVLLVLLIIFMVIAPHQKGVDVATDRAQHRPMPENPDVVLFIRKMERST
jgi:biopolymer transport protein TolR